MLSPEIRERLKNIPEQINVVGPIVQKLVEKGWDINQMIFGKNEWKVPKNPSSSNNREKGRSYDGFPVDIAIFDSPQRVGDYKSLVVIIECKQGTETTGLEQLDIYLGLEPYVKLGIWANNPDDSSLTVNLFKDEKGITHPQKKTVSLLPGPNSRIDKDYKELRGVDLIPPSEESLMKAFKELLGKIVAQDGNVTRREEQLDQLCNIILLKLDSDKKSRMNPNDEVSFKPSATEHKTSENLKRQFDIFVKNYPDIFIDTKDKELRFSDHTLAECVDYLAPLNLVKVAPHAVSLAFQVLRSAALKQEEGQYFTPQPVIEAAVKLAGVNNDDIILDPACGTGGFLVECLMQMRDKIERNGGETSELSRWAQLKLHGIDKDAIAIKLTKAIMQILGDGSAHCARGDSVLTHKWDTEYPHLKSNYENGRFTLIFTNPPFGASLKIKYSDAKKANLDLTNFSQEGGELELGLAMFNRCHQLLKDGGKLCIVLPETYFFSPSFKFVRDWCFSRFKIIASMNVPMDAFQGFCRAKTNIYVFEKLKKERNIGEVIDNSTDKVLLLNPVTCGIYKNGGKRYKVDENGVRTNVIDNQMLEHVEQLNALGTIPKSGAILDEGKIVKNDVFVPSYYNPIWDEEFNNLVSDLGCSFLNLGEMEKKGYIEIRGGNGSPGNDQRVGEVPYIKVSDIRSLRVNINPTNMIPLALARKLWRGERSPFEPWDLISPNRASSNIGEFAVLLPGEEQVVLTKEMFVIRITEKGRELFDPFYLLWAFSLRVVRNQWKRVTLMQTNREDVGDRYMEVKIPMPKNKVWGQKMSIEFKNYFETIAKAREIFHKGIELSDFKYIGSLSGSSQPEELDDEIIISEEDTRN